jgi:hypothetical protein
VLKSSADEERGILGGWDLFQGSDATCQQLSATSFHCTPQRPPAGTTFYDKNGQQVNDVFLGMKTATVDSNLHIRRRLRLHPAPTAAPGTATSATKQSSAASSSPACSAATSPNRQRAS